MKRASLLTLTLIGAFSAIQAAWAVDYPLPPTGSRLVGQNQTYTVQEGDKNLQAIARRFDTAAMLILEANNTIAPVRIPHSWHQCAGQRRFARQFGLYSHECTGY